MASIALKGVTKRYGDTYALRETDLEIADHEFLVLVGPSGSGKTTLLRLIAGLEILTDGEIFFGDRRVSDVDVGDRDIAMVFQNYGLYPHMSVYQNMAFGLRKRGLPKPAIDQHVRHTAGLLGIEHLLTRKPRQLSGGQRQRVALGRAIVRDPAVFLLDEPLSNLDAHLRIQMRAEILRVHRSVTATAVYVTHDQVEAMTMGDRIAVVSEGVLQQVGTPDELYDEPVNRFVAGFIGTPPMGFLDCEVAAADGSAELRSTGVSVRLPRETAAALPAGLRRVIAGVRPEHLKLADVTSSGTAPGGTAPGGTAPGDTAPGGTAPGGTAPGDTAPASTAPAVQGSVEVIEPLGSEQHVIVKVGEAMVTARMAREHKVGVGEKIAFTLDPARLHVFDPDSGRALR